MNSKPVPVTVRILDTDYRVSCPPEELESLQAAAAVLSERMREIRESGKILGVERIAVMAALNISYELLHDRASTDKFVDSHNGRIRDILQRVEQTLSKSV